MSIQYRFKYALKALRQLDPIQVALYTWYQFGLYSGLMRWRTPPGTWSLKNKASLVFAPQPVFSLPSRQDLASALGDSAPKLLAEADEILQGKVRLFGGKPVPLQLNLSGSQQHWTAYAKGENLDQIEDIKFVWEHGRFGWAYTLGRAYHLSDDERYAKAYWELCETFLESNPPHLGPHWTSAQEVAIRLITMVFTYYLFMDSKATTPERKELLAAAIAAHADRIPPSLAYSRAQNNNHLLVEALGLYTAGIALPNHSSAASWRQQGWRWFSHALLTQISPDGIYIQQSCNYHRLMLQAALWGFTIAHSQRQSLQPKVLNLLQMATCWLLALVDTKAGRVPNLGPNDGAYIMPLASCSFYDYRPVLQAASLAFLGEPAFPEGPWDEMALWLGARDGSGLGGIKNARKIESSIPAKADSSSEETLPHTLSIPEFDSWAYFRVARFNHRPGHADQLHLDLWWRGNNISKDPGTYLYNGAPPWDNSLVSTSVHNTIILDDHDQMTRAGRFLWLDWAQAKVESRLRAGDASWERLTASHDGYNNLGATHRRSVTAHAGGRWVILDELTPNRRTISQPTRRHTARVHWLLPDWPWEFENESNEQRMLMLLHTPHGPLKLQIVFIEERFRIALNPATSLSSKIKIVRAGELLWGEGPVSPVLGWVSPTYGVNTPALSVIFELHGMLPLILESEFILPPNHNHLGPQG